LENSNSKTGNATVWRVGCVPGDNFYGEGTDGDTYLRFAFCRSLASLSEAVDRLKRLTAG
jgi:aspartate/methionine/tyrosine aminotransferase